MNIFANILRPFKVSAASPTDKAGWFVRWATGTDGNTATVNNQSAMQLSAVYDCIRIISEDVAKLPLQVFQKQERGRNKLSNHNLYYLFNHQPNPEMSAISFRQTLTSHALGYGNGYAEIVRDVNGDIDSLWILPPDKITPKRNDNNEIYYEYRHSSGNTINIPFARILHLPGFGFDGIQGYNVIHLARESMGLALTAEKQGSKFLSNGSKASGVVECDNVLSEGAFNNLKKSIESQVSGDNLYKILLLEEGAKFKSVSISPVDAQLLETRQFSIQEICRWFRIQPHKVADLSKATFSNIEHQSLEYVSDTLMPWFVRWEQAIFSKLFTIEEQSANYYVKHNANALLRGDTKTRYEAYGKGIIDGWLTRNEARELEELNPLNGLDEPLVPLNMAKANGEIIDDIAARIANTEINAISARIDKAEQDKEKFNQWIISWYGKHVKYIEKSLSVINTDTQFAQSIADSGIDQITNDADIFACWKNGLRQWQITNAIKEELKCTQK